MLKMHVIYAMFQEPRFQVCFNLITPVSINIIIVIANCYETIIYKLNTI